MLLGVLSSNAAAAWIQVSGNDVVIIYADRATIRKSGNSVKMWVMDDFKDSRVSSTGKQYLSSKSLNEYDCKNEQRRTLFFTWHSGQMGNGNIVYSDDGVASNWRPVAPGSAGATLWGIACGKQGG